MTALNIQGVVTDAAGASFTWLSTADDQTVSVDVTTFGAKGDGLTTSAVANLAAINAAIASGGGNTIYFPPGVYWVSGPIVNLRAGTSIRIAGANMCSTWIRGNFYGYVIDQGGDGTNLPGSTIPCVPPGLSSIPNWAATLNCIQSIENITVNNAYLSNGTDYGTGAIRFNNTQNGVVRNVQFHGWTGLASYCGTFETLIDNCGSTGPGTSNGSIGFFGGGGLVSNCAVLGYTTAYWFPGYGNGTLANRLRAESSQTGYLCAGNTAFTECQSERCDTGFLGAPRSIRSMMLTGTVGCFKNIVSATWAAGTVTMKSLQPLANFGWTPGQTHWIIVEGTTPAGYKSYPGWVLATAVDTVTFTYPMATDPGGPYTTGGDWSFPIQYGMRLYNLNHGATVDTVTLPGACEKAALDLGSGGFSMATLTGVNAGSGGWIMPPSTVKGGVRYINCDQPTGSQLDAAGKVAGMKFADLPGQPNQTSFKQPLLEGDQYDIIDCNASTFGATAAGAGAGHARVRYNGTNWTVSG